MSPRTVAVLAGFALPLIGCGDDTTYTLYRNSPVAGLRIHWATFDADEREAYNSDNCRMAADLLNRQAQPGIRWWCEKGRYRP